MGHEDDRDEAETWLARLFAGKLYNLEPEVRTRANIETILFNYGTALSESWDATKGMVAQMEVDVGEGPLQARVDHPVTSAFLRILAMVVEAPEVTNFVTFHFRRAENPMHLVVTILKSEDSKTPAARIAELEQQVKELQEALGIAGNK